MRPLSDQKDANDFQNGSLESIGTGAGSGEKMVNHEKGRGLRSPSAAARMRRYRTRRRAGTICVTIELEKAEVDALIRKGFLNREMRNNATAVRDALYRFYAAHWVEYHKLSQARYA